MIDLNSTVTQSSFGELVGISQPAVSDLLKRGILREGAPVGEWIRSYCDRMRDMAAGRGGESSMDLATERARLAREQADKIAMQNAVTRRELAPTSLLESVLAAAGARVVRLLETIPSDIRRRAPQLTSADLAGVRAVINKARNVAANVSLSDLEFQLDSNLRSEENDSRETHPADDGVDPNDHAAATDCEDPKHLDRLHTPGG